MCNEAHTRRFPSDPRTLMPQLLLYGRICSIYYCHLEAVLRTVDRGSGRFPGEMNAHQPPWAKRPQSSMGAARNDGFLVKLTCPGTSSRAVFPSARAALFFLKLDFPGVRDSRNEMSRRDLSAALSRKGFGERATFAAPGVRATEVLQLRRPEKSWDMLRIIT